MSKHHNNELSLEDVHGSVDPAKHTKLWRRLLSFAGPAYLVSVGYMDPGNWATDLQGGSKFGYKLIWVLLMSNLMALLLQSLSTRLGIVRRRDLAQANREVYPPLVNFSLYILAELAIAACDLAEVLGMAIGINLLTGLPVLWGVIITVLDTFILLVLQRYGIRKIEAFIIALIATISLSFLVELIWAQPHVGDVLTGFIPTRLNNEALYIAVGIIGATVMPHNLYLHSALVQTRKIKPDNAGIKQALRFNLLDSTIALNLAFLVNAAILILAAATFFSSGRTDVARIEDAYNLLPMLGKFAPYLFAIALIAAGQSSTITGTLAGQIVMEGYLSLRINPWIRRLLTRLLAIIPAVVTILVFGDQQLDSLLVLSQVILSMQLGFAIIPLIHFVSDKKAMGPFAIKTPTKTISWIVAGILVYLNVKLVTGEAFGFFKTEGHWVAKGVIIIAGLIFAWLFIMMTLLPVIRSRKEKAILHMHSLERPLKILSIPETQIIAIALDFGKMDEKLIAYAIAQGKREATYVLLHVVETVSAGYLGESAGDFETQQDSGRLDMYASQLKAMSYKVITQVGYDRRVKEIVRIVQETNAGMLVMGAHRHSGLKDYLYGETVDHVRHKITIPVLIVS
ncbi:MAG TPA: Nramp family divalent metal transporter [Chitinophagaceae bacterium]|nr:Nramp family divalent metal transporter [Chitinophagaceae bacterium]